MTRPWDDAWSAVEAVIPDGWRGPVVQPTRDGEYAAWLMPNEGGTGRWEASGSSPAAALRALAEKLGAAPPETPK